MTENILAQQVRQAIETENLASFIRENLEGQRLSIRGLAGLCGVDHKSIIKGGSFSSSALVEIFRSQGIEVATLVKGGFGPAETWLVIEYFAYESKAKALTAKMIARALGSVGVHLAFAEAGAFDTGGSKTGAWKGTYTPVAKTPRLPVSRKHKKRKKLEVTLEAELLQWMDSEGIGAEQQVLAMGKRTDVWMPGICFLELKRGKVNGDDVCQAIKYYQLYSKPVALIGETLMPRAGEGIAAINAIAGVDALCFITWSGARTYITALSDKVSK